MESYVGMSGNRMCLYLISFKACDEDLSEIYSFGMWSKESGQVSTESLAGKEEKAVKNVLWS